MLPLRAQFPNLKSMANTGSLPLGVLLQPFATLDACHSGDTRSQLPPPHLRREPQRCLVCGAFANRYCDVDHRNGRWVCVFCNASSFCRVYVGVERGEVPELAHHVVDYALQRPPPSSSPRSGSTEHVPLVMPPPCCAFVLDATLDESQMAGARTALLAAMDALPADARICLVTYTSCVAVHHLGGAPAGGDEDVAFGEPAECTSIHALANMEQRTRMLHDAETHGAVCIARVSSSRAALEHALQALRPWPQQRLTADQKPATGTLPRCIGPAVATALQLVRGAAGVSTASDDQIERSPWAEVAVHGRIALLAAGPPTVGPGSGGDAHSVWTELGAAARRAGVVVDVLSCGTAPCDIPRLMPMIHGSGGVAVLCTDGFGTTGAAAAAVLPSLLAGGQDAHQASCIPVAAGVDVRCTQGVQVHRIIGGVAPMPKGADMAPQAVPNSGGPSYPDTAAATALYPSPQHRACGSVGYLLRLQEDTPARHMLIQFVIRSVFAASHDAAGAGDTGMQGPETTCDSVRVITRRLKCTADEEVYGNSVVAKIAALLALKADAADACRSIKATDSDVAAANMSADGVVSDSSIPLAVTSYAPNVPGAMALQEAQCVQRLTHMAAHHGTRADRAAAGGLGRRRSRGPQFVLSNPLCDFARYLYHATRGPLTAGSSPAACEGATAAMAWLVHAPVDQGAATVMPRLYRVHCAAGASIADAAAQFAASVAAPAPGDDTRGVPPCGRVLRSLTSPWASLDGEHHPALLTEVPVVDMALRSQDTLLLDAGTELILWMGASASTASEDGAATKSHTEEMSKHLLAALGTSLSCWRTPAPAVRATRQGASQARRLTARLEPLHKDPPAHRVATWPELAGWKAPHDDSAAALLAAQMLPTDSPSFTQWLDTHGISGRTPPPAAHVGSGRTQPPSGTPPRLPVKEGIASLPPAPATPMRV